jgi:hypothetical protein
LGRPEEPARALALPVARLLRELIPRIHPAAAEPARRLLDALSAMIDS